MDNSFVSRGRGALLLGATVSFALGALFLLYVVCFIGILGAGPSFVWTGMEDYIAHAGAHDQTLKTVSYAGMLLFCLLWAVFGQCVAEQAAPRRGMAARAGAMFGALFALASGMNYFLQLTAVRLNLLKGAAGGLEQFVMSNPISAIAAVNMLGWTVLLGLSCLFLSFAFVGAGAARAARVCLRVCAAVCLAAAAGYAADSVWVVGICMYPLLGGSVLAVSVAAGLFFRRGLRSVTDITP